MVKVRRLIKEYTDGQSAHCNELIIKDDIAQCSLLAHAALICEDLYVLAGVSPKRILLFEELQSDQDENSNAKAQRLQSLSVTRWTTRGKTTKIVIEARAHFTGANSVLEQNVLRINCVYTAPPGAVVVPDTLTVHTVLVPIVNQVSALL